MGVTSTEVEVGGIPIPLISHIEGPFYVGGFRRGINLAHAFTTVMSCFWRGRYQTGEGVEHLSHYFWDLPKTPDQDKVYRAAVALLEAAQAGPVLVHCAGGLNRSPLVLGQALIISGRTPGEAIDLMRAQRSTRVLNNEHFEEFLRAQRKE